MSVEKGAFSQEYRVYGKKKHRMPGSTDLPKTADAMVRCFLYFNEIFSKMQVVVFRRSGKRLSPSPSPFASFSGKPDMTNHKPIPGTVKNILIKKAFSGRKISPQKARRASLFVGIDSALWEELRLLYTL